MNLSSMNKFHFALIRYMPNIARGETLNIGIVVRSGKEQVVKWDDDFVAPSFFGPLQPTSEIILNWKQYFLSEFDLNPGIDDHNTEIFWDKVRKKIITKAASFELGLTRKHWDLEQSIETVADSLFKRLVRRPVGVSHGMD